MLLEGGADPRAMDINGCAPIQYLLKVTGVRPMGVPHLCYQLLLNHNAARVYPPQFHKVREYTELGDWDTSCMVDVVAISYMNMNIYI